MKWWRTNNLIPSSPRFVFDPASDTQHQNPGSLHVLHVFTASYQGMRSAAGYAPGRKLMLKDEAPLSAEEQSRIVAELAAYGVTHAVFHSHTPAMDGLARKLARQGLVCIGLWHGASTQFWIEHERRAFQAMMALEKEQTLRRVAAVKPDMPLVEPRVWERVAFNFPPRIKRAEAHAAPDGVVLVPVEANWVKNLHTNVFAAGSVAQVKRVHLCSPFPKELNWASSAELVVHPRPDRDTLFELIAQSSVVMNASLSECQSMTWLEALALSVPCLVPVLGLSEVAHPFLELVQVANPDRLGSVASALRQLLQAQRADVVGLGSMMDDFLALWRAKAQTRWEELLSPPSAASMR